MFVQLDQSIPVYVTGKGAGYALAVIDYGQEHNLIWVTALDETGEIWCAPNPLVRVRSNWTMRRDLHENGAHGGQPNRTNGVVHKPEIAATR